MRFVTVATDNQGYFPYLLESCRRHGIVLDVLGWGQKWRGYNWRIELGLDYLKSVQETEIVCFLDAYDVILCASAHDIAKRFLQMCDTYDAKIITGFENPMNPVTKGLAKYVFGTCKDKMLNAGTYIGNAAHLTKLFNTMRYLTKNPQDNDQTVMTRACSMYPKGIYVDDKSELFLTLNSSFREVDVPIEDNKIVLESGSRPCVLHANGNTRIDRVLRKLGYNVPSEFVQYMNRYQRIALIDKAKHYIKNFVPCILVLAVIIYIARTVMTTNTLTSRSIV